jgi:hypothetical protein
MGHGDAVEIPGHVAQGQQATVAGELICACRKTRGYGEPHPCFESELIQCPDLYLIIVIPLPANMDRGDGVNHGVKIVGGEGG